MEIFGCCVADDRDVRTSGNRRAIFRESAKVPGVPGVADYGGKGVSIPPTDTQDRSELALEGKKALILHALVGDYLLKRYDIREANL